MIKFLFLIAGVLLTSYSRVMVAKYHSVFYYKGRKKGSNPIIEKWKDNIHILANQAYRSLFGALFCFLMAFLLPQFGWISLLYSLIIVFLTSASASYEWQKWINLGVGLPEIDPKETQSYEFIIFGKSYVIPKFWYGKRRKPIAMFSLIGLIGFIIYLISNGIHS